MAINNSINTNVGAMVALRNLAAVNRDLSIVQDRVSTGLRVSNAKIDASVFSVGQGLRADLKSYEAVATALASGKGVLSVAISAATAMSDLMQDVKAKIVQLADESLTTQMRSTYEDDLESMVGQLRNFVARAEYNSISIIGTGAADISVVRGVDGTALTIRSQTLETDLGTFSATAVALASAASAQGALSATGIWQTFFDALGTSLGELGADNRAVEFQLSFNQSIADAVTEGLGALVDADLAKESAKLQALQTKQQLSVQTLSIANAQPQTLLGLFRG
jgi:flagellin